MNLHTCGRIVAPVLAFAALLVPAARAAGQVLPPVPAEMSRLDFLLGEWEGAGWMEYEPGQRGEFRVREHVERRMGGRLVVVEGRSTAWMGDELGDVPVHEALGLFSYDAATERMLFRTYTARGVAGTVQPAEVGENRVVWGYTDPRHGEVRYTITLTPAGEWHEVGEMSRDGGASWREFLVMTLRRR